MSGWTLEQRRDAVLRCLDSVAPPEVTLWVKAAIETAEKTDDLRYLIAKERMLGENDVPKV